MSRIDVNKTIIPTLSGWDCTPKGVICLTEQNLGTYKCFSGTATIAAAGVATPIFTDIVDMNYGTATTSAYLFRISFLSAAGNYRYVELEFSCAVTSTGAITGTPFPLALPTTGTLTVAYTVTQVAAVFTNGVMTTAPTMTLNANVTTDINTAVVFDCERVSIRSNLV